MRRDLEPRIGPGGLFSRSKGRGDTRAVYALAFAFLLVACEAAPDPPPAAVLDLNEVWSQAVPAGFEVAGATGDTGEFLVWSRLGSKVLVGTPGEAWRELGLGLHGPPISVHSVGPGSPVHVLDTSSSSGQRDAALSDRLQKTTVHSTTPVEAAVPDRQRWVLVSRVPSGELGLFSVPFGGIVSLQHALPFEVLDSLPVSSRWGRLPPIIAVIDSSLVVAMPVFPWTLTWLSREGRILHVRNLAQLAGLIPSMPGDRTMVLVGLLALDRGALVVLADPGSYNRMFVMLDTDGRLERSRRFQAPLGILHTLPKEALAIGIRRLRSQELVGYRWVWKSTPTKNGGQP